VGKYRPKWNFMLLVTSFPHVYRFPKTDVQACVLEQRFAKQNRKLQSMCLICSFRYFVTNVRSQGSSVSTEARLRAGRPGFIPGGGNDGIRYPCHRVQIGLGAHTASYPMATGGSFPGGKVASA
jgi:hypothetical protein